MNAPVSSVLALWEWIDFAGAVTIILLSIAVLVICVGALVGLVAAGPEDD